MLLHIGKYFNRSAITKNCKDWKWGLNKTFSKWLFLNVNYIMARSR